MRAAIIEQRRCLSAHDHQFLSWQICRNLIATEAFQQAQTIAFYIAIGGEVDPFTALVQAWTAGKQCYLPLLDPDKPDHMDFVHYQQDTELKTNQFGILEPSLSKKTQIAMDQLDLVICPLVAFDQQGHRVGMGKGFYDRTFEFVLKKTTTSRPVLIGLAYEFQRLETIKPNAWDVPMDNIITEVGAIIPSPE